jgi:hypothetical protein
MKVVWDYPRGPMGNIGPSEFESGVHALTVEFLDAMWADPMSVAGLTPALRSPFVPNANSFAPGTLGRKLASLQLYYHNRSKVR